MYKVEVKYTDNADKFRQAAICFQKNGYYTPHPKGTTAYLKYWDEESHRCLEGFTTDDGEWISGYFYFYLNYSPIIIRETVGESKRAKSRREFPNFWDYDRAFFDAVEEAEKNGTHLAFLKPRGIGASFKGASMLARNYFLIPDSKSFAVTEETEHLTKDGILTKSFEICDFVNEHTAWSKKSQKVNTKFHKRASFMVNNGASEMEVGYKSEIIGFSVKNDPDKGRGKRGKLCIIDEIGLISSPVHLYSTLRHGFEEDGVSFGLIILQGTGGCLCAGQKVWDNYGNLINIEDLKTDQGILGFNGKSISKETISYWQEPKQKHCYRLTTNTLRTLECSEDHPILTAIINKDYRILGNTFTETSSLQIGDKIAVIDEVPIFGDKPMWEPRMIGWLIGDGTYGNKQTPKLSNCEQEILEYIESRYKTSLSDSYITKSSGKLYKELNISNIRPFLRELGIYGQVKLNKRLPLQHHSYSKYSLSELLGGLFDTDGYVNIRNNKKRGTWIAEISISQSSLELINEIRLLLQKFGIHGRVRIRKPRPTNPKDKKEWYEFTISDTRSLLKFVENIKLSPKEKQDRLNKIYEVFSNITPLSVHEGVRYEDIINIEYIGIKDVYNLTADNTHTYIGNGIITHNTEDADFSELRQLFYEPKVNNLLEVENVWDEGKFGTSCGFFWPRDYCVRGYIDSNGNSDTVGARQREIREREKIIEHASDRNQIDRFVAERPLCPNEALLQISMNIFPKKELLNHLSYIQTHESLKKFKQVGDLDFSPSGSLIWTQATRPKDITKYRLRADDSKEGQIVIWEHPIENPPYGLYCGGLDPYEFDQAATSDSLGSVIIYKRFQSFEKYFEIPVAEYTGRPATVEEFYENCRKLAIYYNAKILYENEKKGIYVHFAQKHCEHLLADQPDIIKDIIQNSRVERGKGIHMNKFIKQYGELRLRDWLNEEYEPGKKNLTKLLSEPLLEELIEYNSEGNFDRVIAMLLIMIYREELFHIVVKETKKDNKKHMLFPDGLFGSNKKDNDFFSNLLKDTPTYRPWR